MTKAERARRIESIQKAFAPVFDSLKQGQNRIDRTARHANKRISALDNGLQTLGRRVTSLDKRAESLAETLPSGKKINSARNKPENS